MVVITPMNEHFVGDTRTHSFDNSFIHCAENEQDYARYRAFAIAQLQEDYQESIRFSQDYWLIKAKLDYYVAEGMYEQHTLTSDPATYFAHMRSALDLLSESMASSRQAQIQAYAIITQLDDTIFEEHDFREARNFLRSSSRVLRAGNILSDQIVFNQQFLLTSLERAHEKRKRRPLEGEINA